MVMPVMENIRLPLLRIIVDGGGELRINEAIVQVEQYFPQLTDQDKQRPLSSKGLAWPNRVQWARQELVLQGYLYREPRGIWRITPDGRTYLEQHWSNWAPRYSGGMHSEAGVKAWETRKSRVTAAQKTIEEVEQEKVLPEPSPRLHKKLQEMLDQVGNILGYHSETEYREPPYIYDVVWKEYQGAPRASVVFEVQDRGNLIEALAKLQHAKEAWGSRLFLVVTGERDHRRVDQLVAPLLSGTFHRLARDMMVLTSERVQELHGALESNRDLLRRLLPF